MRPSCFAPIACLALLLTPACTREIVDPTEGSETGEELSADSEETRWNPEGIGEQEDWPLVVFLGDSLTAGLGVPAAEAFPAVLAELLAAAGEPIRVVNAGISGDTSAGGLNRVDWALSSKPDLVVVELGANDGLRGLDPADTEENLRQILRKVNAAGARALLVGIYMPSNYGPDYTQRFASLFPRLAEEEGVPLLPFLLEGVAGIPELNQADGIHPNSEGHRRVAEHVFELLFEELREETVDG